jgi:hypothetical protein
MQLGQGLYYRHSNEASPVRLLMGLIAGLAAGRVAACGDVRPITTVAVHCGAEGWRGEFLTQALPA